MTNLGTVQITSFEHLFLQAYNPGGEIHASNNTRGTEETWFLIEVDKANNIYGFLNWANHCYMSKQPNGCVPAISPTLGQTEQFTVSNGAQWGAPGASVIRTYDGFVLGSLGQGNNSTCGGEVSAQGTAGPQPKALWPGWWYIGPCGLPEPSKGFWGTLGNFFDHATINFGPGPSSNNL